MPRRKIRDVADAHACLNAAAASGLPRAVWARANGIDARSLNAWRITLDRKAPHPASSRLIELVPLSPPRASTYVVRCGPLAVELDDDFDDHVLRRLLAVVVSC